MTPPTPIQQQFLLLYETDQDFHREVDHLIWGEVDDLRVALRQIESMRRDTFQTGFDYEMAVRKTAATALRRLAS